MNKIVYILICCSFLMSCSHSKTSDPQPQDSVLLIGTWSVKTVELDGVFVTSYFTGMKLTFTTDGKYIVVNPVSPVWKASGTFTREGNTITRDDGTKVNIVSVSSSSLKLEFNYVAANSRTSSVSGKYEFEFTR